MSFKHRRFPAAVRVIILIPILPVLLVFAIAYHLVWQLLSAIIEGLREGCRKSKLEIASFWEAFVDIVCYIVYGRDRDAERAAKRNESWRKNAINSRS